VLVVTDLAWPHIAGVRYWVAQGARIVAHRAAVPFLTSVVNRRWIATPDMLEQKRHALGPFHVNAVSDSLRLAGGDLLVFAIDGVASEVALAAYIRPERFLWASDYIQTVGEPTAYLEETVRAVERVAITPERAAAEHLPLTPWTTVQGLSRPGGDKATGPRR
jgi:hypothetical protein